MHVSFMQQLGILFNFRKFFILFPSFFLLNFILLLGSLIRLNV